MNPSMRLRYTRATDSKGDRMRLTLAAIALTLALTTGCSTTAPKEKFVSFQSDIDFLKQHTPIVLLSDPDGQAQVAIAPAYQGRVMTSTAAGQSGQSFGWINRELISS